MAHVTKSKKQIVTRLNRIVGQLEGIRRMVDTIADDDDLGCYKIMQQLTASRGAINSLMTKLLEEHLEFHIVERQDREERHEGARELLKVMRSFTK